MSTISPTARPADDAEWTATLAVARYAAGVASAGDVARAAKAVTDWSRLERHVSEEGLTLLLARALTESGMDMSSHHVSSLMTRSAVLATRALGQFRELADVYDALDHVGIASLPYKGPLLSWRLYGDAALRISTDLDLVVARGAYSHARDLLVSRGLAPRRGHSLARERMLFRWLGHASFGVGDITFVELHWRFAPQTFPFALDPRDALGRARDVRIGSRAFRMMDDRDLAVTLAMHGTRHLFERLEWLSGFARLVSTIEASPEDLLSHATRLHARRMLLIAVAVAQLVVSLELSAEWEAALRDDPQALRIAAMLVSDIALRGTNQPVTREGTPLQRLYAGMMDGPVDAARLLVSGVLLPTEREWEAVRIPDALSSLYLIVRPLRLLGRALVAAARPMRARAGDA